MEEKEYYQTLGCFNYGFVVFSFIMMIVFIWGASYDMGGVMILCVLLFGFLGAMTIAQIVNSKKPVLVIHQDSIEFRSLYSGSYNTIPFKDIDYFKFENHVSTMFGAEVSGFLKVKVFLTNGITDTFKVPTDTGSAEEIAGELIQHLAMYRARR